MVKYFLSFSLLQHIFWSLGISLILLLIVSCSSLTLPFCTFQRPGAPADGVRGREAHGARRVRLRVRGRPHAPHELRVAQRVRDVAPSRAGLHGRRRRHEGLARTHEGSLLRRSGGQRM